MEYYFILLIFLIDSFQTNRANIDVVSVASNMNVTNCDSEVIIIQVSMTIIRHSHNFVDIVMIVEHM